MPIIAHAIFANVANRPTDLREVTNDRKRPCKRSDRENGYNAERLGKFVPEHSNAFKRIVENVHAHASKSKDQMNDISRPLI